MRTVSFSQPEISRQLNRDFVCFTTSTEGDASAGESIRHRPNDPAGTCIRGNGQQNVQTLFLTPEGEIFHVISGYVSPEELSVELQFASKLFAALKKVPTNDRPNFIAEAHRSRLQQMGFSDDEIRSRGLNVGMGMSLPFEMPGKPAEGLAQTTNRDANDKSFANLDYLLRQLPTSSEISANGPFGMFVRGQISTDHKFCIDYPLQNHESFDRDPTPLVGNGKSFFMSSSSGMPPGR